MKKFSSSEIRKSVSKPFFDEKNLPNKNKSYPKISVVTISYNQTDFLADCIKSVLSQGYSNLEYIVVDPGSTDGSRDIIQRNSDSMSKIIFETDDGPADGLNKGFSHATGDIFCYLNSDDVFLPGAFHKIGNLFKERPEIDVILGNGFQLDQNGEKVKKIFSTPFNLKSYAYGGCTVVQQATFFRREAFLKTKGFNSSNRSCWDGELIVDLAQSGAKFMYVNEHIGCFRIYPDSITGSQQIVNLYKSDRDRMFNKITGHHKRKIDKLISFYYRIIKLFSHLPRAIQ